MSKARGYPSNQPFNVNGRRNLTKKNSWWSNSPYHNNGTKKAER